MTNESFKKMAAEAALKYIQPNVIIGVGSGTTVNYFIDALASVQHKIEAAIASSKVTEKKLKAIGIPVWELNEVSDISLYVDSADEINPHLQMIKGGGGALTREKIIASVAKQFVCIADNTKYVNVLGEFPIALEVIPMARSFVGREIVKRGGDPVYREGFVTDNGNIIIDVYHLQIREPIKLEHEFNHIPGVVCAGIFAQRSADVLLLAGPDGVQTMSHFNPNLV